MKGRNDMSLTETLTIAPAGTWTLDPVHSRVDFEVTYLAGTFRGEFQKIAGELTVDGARASLAGVAEVSSVDVKDEDLSAHLQSPDFFDAERHPELRFDGHDIRLDGQTVAVDGEITIKGVTQPVTVTGTVTVLSAAVDRTDFGVDWNTPLPSGEQALANDVKILADLQFVKAGA
jgi:polyisoprenoid-binding protein YceI